MSTRRNTVFGLAALAGGVALWRGLLPAPPAKAARAYEVTRTEADWRAVLTQDQFGVLRQGGTERPGSSPLDKEVRAGTYHCAGCALPLFSSLTKYNSGTGWPSFYQALANAVVEDTDTSWGLTRVEVLCRRCGGHLGHVFDDGPQPTGLRYCMNGLAMKFTEQAA